VGQILSHITSAEVGLHVIRDLTEKDTGAGALQRTIIDRVLSLLPRDVVGAPAKKRKRESSAPEVKAEDVDEEEDTSPKNVAVRPDRIKKLTANRLQTRSPGNQLRSTPRRGGGREYLFSIWLAWNCSTDSSLQVHRGLLLVREARRSLPRTM
jgi:hypothetical protein